MFQNNEKKYPKLDNEVASSIIENVFEACGKAPSTVPLNVLSSYTEYRRDRFSLQKGITIFILIVFLLLPLCFVYPHFTVKEIERSSTGIPTFEVRVSNKLPVRLVSAKLDEHSIAVFESEAKTFFVEPGDNGHLTITVTLANRQFDVWSTEVSGVDATAPTLLDSELINGKIRIFLDDSGVGVDFESCYAVSSGGDRFSPYDYNEDRCYAEFEFEQDMNIFIPDFNGNVLQLVLSKPE